MTPGELVQHLRAQGVSVTALGGQLQVVGPCDTHTAALRAELRWRRTEALELLGSRGSGGSCSPLPPKTHATVQHLPAASQEDLSAARAQFARYGTQPAEDDLTAAALVERHLGYWQDVLDGVYRGDLTLCFVGENQPVVRPVNHNQGDAFGICQFTHRLTRRNRWVG